MHTFFWAVVIGTVVTFLTISPWFGLFVGVMVFILAEGGNESGKFG